MLSEEEQSINRKEMIPKINAVVEVKTKILEYRFVFYALIVIGFFLLIGSIISIWFGTIAGLVLMAGGLWFSKKESDYLLFLKEKYGV